MTDKVQKIKEWIQMRKLCTMDEHMKFYSNAAEAEYNALCNIEHFIDSMQEESEDDWKYSIAEKLGVSKDEFDKMKPVSEPIDFEQELYKAFGQVKDFTLGIQIAKSFYEMGKQHQEPVSEDLEEEIDRYFLNSNYFKSSYKSSTGSLKPLHDAAFYFIQLGRNYGFHTCEELDEDIEKEWNCYSKDGDVAVINRFGFNLIARHFAKWQKQQDSKLPHIHPRDTIEEYAYQCAYDISNDWAKETPEWRDVQTDCMLGAQWQKEKDSIPSKDWEELIDALSKRYPEVSFAKLSRIAVRVSRWQQNKDKQILNDEGIVVLSEKEFEKMKRSLIQLSEREQRMMAKAIDVEVKVDAGGYPYIPQMELYDYDKDMPLAKEGDKYKVVLIKEE